MRNISKSGLPFKNSNEEHKMLMTNTSKVNPRIKKILLVLPIIMATMIAGGAIFGIYLSELIGSDETFLLSILTATVGFGVSIVISVYLIKVIAID